MSQYFLKILIDGNRVIHTKVDESVDELPLRSVILGGVTFNETNIVTVSGVNSLTSVIDSVSSASDDNDDFLYSEIISVSSASDDKDDFLYSEIISVSSASDDNDDFLLAVISSVSGASSLRDDAQDLELFAVSGALQAQIDAITSDLPKEERFFVSGGQTVIDINDFTFDASPTIKDIKVYKNGNIAFQSSTGALVGEKTGGDFTKNSSSQLLWLYPLKDGDKIVVRDERTGGGGGGGGGTDLENVTVNTKPLISGAVNLGGPTRGWGSLFVKDKLNSDVYEIQVSGGVLLGVQI